MYNLIIAFLFLILPVISVGQPGHETGFPFIKNYTTVGYRAHAQNFAIAGDQHGLMYFGNFAGVMQYDGETWRLIQTEKSTKVSALAIDSAGKVYVGARGEIGYLETDKNGGLQFISLLKDLKTEYSPFYEILQVFIVHDIVYFISENAVFSLNEGNISLFETPNEVLGAFLINDLIYLQIKETGLMTFQNEQLKKVGDGQLFSGAAVITSMLPYKNNEILIATSTQGLFRLVGETVQPFKAEVNDLLMKNPVTSAISLSDGTFALGTSRIGVIIMNSEGDVVQVIDKEASLQNSFVRALYKSNDNTLWAALNNGISMIEIPSTFTYFDQKSGLEGAVNQIIRYENTLYVATYQGLYYYDENLFGFVPVKEIISACWSVIPFDGSLFAATSQGIFSVKNKKATFVYDCFAISLVTSKNDLSSLFVGETGGFYKLERDGSHWGYSKFEGVDDEIIDLQTDAQGNVWGATLSKGVFHYKPGEAAPVVFNKQNGLPEDVGISINPFANTICVSSIKGVFVFNETNQSFDSIQFIDSMEEQSREWYSLILPDNKGDLWITEGDETHIKLLSKKENFYVPVTKPFLPISDNVVWSILPEENGIAWFGGPDGLIRYNPLILNKNTTPFPNLIRKITINNDSIYYSGNTDLSDHKMILDFSHNSLGFEFSAPFYAVKGNLQYQYYLEGFEETWNDWSYQSGKEYTNIPGGKYVFHVRAKNSFGELAREATFHFLVLSPWYYSIWSLILYISFTAGIIYLIVILRNRNLLKEKRILEERIANRTAEVVQQKEEIENQSQELANKNDELEKINSAIKSINAEINFENLLQSLLEKMKIIRSAEKSLALVFDKNSEAYRYKACIGYSLSEFDEITINLAQAENRYLKNTEEVFEDIFIKSEFSTHNEIEVLQKYAKPKSMMVLVIRIENKIEAFLIFENHSRENAFETRDISLIKNSKEHIISAIIRTRILEDLQQTLHNLKDTQDQLVQSEKLASLGQLTAGIAHEIQNPLNFVNNFASLSVDLANELQETIEEIKDNIPPEKYEDVEDVIGLIKGNIVKINEHGKRVESIVKGMLQHSRGKTGEFEEIDINNMVSEYVNLAYHGMKAKEKSFNTAIRTLLDPAVGKASILPQDLSRVILNIVNNACYAVDEKTKKNIPDFRPEVIVSTKKIHDKIEIKIKDNGTGIPDHVIEKIFNPFFTTKPTGKGTGLGLSMSFDIVNKIHKGKLEVKSQLGEYTEFIITIPEKQS
jgi:signal transduction histidine kinase/ligand-binding sensor domain-containing protein